MAARHRRIAVHTHDKGSSEKAAGKSLSETLVVLHFAHVLLQLYCVHIIESTSFDYVCIVAILSQTLFYFLIDHLSTMIFFHKYLFIFFSVFLF